MTTEPLDNQETPAEPPPDSAANQESSAETENASFSMDVAELNAQVADLKDRLLRTQAEMENFRRRSANEAIEAAKYQAMPIVRDLVPVMDNLERAIASAEQTGDVSNLLEGIRMVSRQLSDTLKAHGTEAIVPDGEAFDPNLHEALSQVPTADYPPMTVVQVVEKGFRMHDRIVRPARVIVSGSPPSGSSGEAADADV